MVTFAQAQERAEQWINGDVPPYEHREVRVREFELGFVIWSEPREGGPSAGDGGDVRVVIARDSGEATLWPALPVGELIRRYEEEYGAVPNDAAPEPPQRIDLEATSFLLSPPQWLQDAADRMGVPDRRPGSTGGGAGAGAASGSDSGSAAGSDGAGTESGTGESSGRIDYRRPAAAQSAPQEPEQPAAAAPAAAGSGSSGGVDYVRRPAVPEQSAPPQEGGSWAGKTVSDSGEGQSVPVPATVFAPPISGADLPDEPPRPDSAEARTKLLPGGSAAPEPQAPQPPAPAQGGVPHTVGGSAYPPPSGPGVSLPPPYTAQPVGSGGAAAHSRSGAADIAGLETAKAVRPGGPDTPPPVGASVPPVPPAPHGGTPRRRPRTTTRTTRRPCWRDPAAAASRTSPSPACPAAVRLPRRRPLLTQARAPRPRRLMRARAPRLRPRPTATRTTPPPCSRAPAPHRPSRAHPAAVRPRPRPRLTQARALLPRRLMRARARPRRPRPTATRTTPPPCSRAPRSPVPRWAAPRRLRRPGRSPVRPPGYASAAALRRRGRPAAPQPPAPAYGYPQPPAGVPTVGPGYMAVLRYRGQDGSEQQIIRRSAPGTPHPEWQILHELRSAGVRPEQVLELHTELESCDLPGGYCTRMIRETWPQVRISHTAPYGRDHASRRQGVQHLLTHQGELHQVAGAPARPQPQRVPMPDPHTVLRVPPVGLDVIGQELAGAFGPPGVFRFDQRAVSRQGVPDIVAQTLMWAGLPVDFGPFFWAQAQPGQPVPTLAELAASRGVQPAADAGSYLVMGNDFGRQLCVQYGTAHIVALPLEAAPAGSPPVAPQFVNSSLPEFARSLALLGRMWRLRIGLTPEQAGHWTVDFQAQLAAQDPAAIASPDNWWSVLIEQMWDGLL
ncbi:SUKH-4 family immunity protein [Actinacidiphila bryophytorum]|uniref:SUKH-4 family immunity protein n=1 Tax=Actinacidiphila bryophytorum TaxID=1436133 RepID=UPI002AFEE9BD|nr:SUKH-4 family immunity protein [Actinacidiphila bryophytorum]